MIDVIFLVTLKSSPNDSVNFAGQVKFPTARRTSNLIPGQFPVRDILSDQLAAFLIVAAAQTIVE